MQVRPLSRFSPLKKEKYLHAGAKPSEFIQILVIPQNPFKYSPPFADIIFRFQADSPAAKKGAVLADCPSLILQKIIGNRNNLLFRLHRLRLWKAPTPLTAVLTR
jgi:hypothetical protein